MDPQFLTIAGASAEGAYSVTQPQAEELVDAKDFITAYQQKFGKSPGYIGPYSYDAVNVIAAAYTAVGKIDNGEAARWLKGRTKDKPLPAISGALYWNADGSRPDFVFSLYQVKDGKMQFIGR
jgi:branched-chain amino acid transport system substrate-binding protein